MVSIRQSSSVALIACSFVLGTLAAYDSSPQAIQKRFESCWSVVQPQADGGCLLLSAFNAHLSLLSSSQAELCKPVISDIETSIIGNASLSLEKQFSFAAYRIHNFFRANLAIQQSLAFQNIGSWGCFSDLYPTAVQVSGTTVGDLLDDVGGVAKVLLKAVGGLADFLLSLLQSVLSVVLGLVSKIVGSLTDQLASCAQVVLQLTKTIPGVVKPLFKVSFGIWGDFQMFFDVCMNTYRYLLVPDLFALVDGEFQLVLDLQAAINNVTFNWLEAEKSALQQYIVFVKGCLSNATLEQEQKLAQIVAQFFILVEIDAQVAAKCSAIPILVEKDFGCLYDLIVCWSYNLVCGGKPQPTNTPSVTSKPITSVPTAKPSPLPTLPSEQPTFSKPTHQPTVQPQPSQKPSETPTEHPLTSKPTAGLTSAPATTGTPCHNDDCRRCQNVIEIIIIKANGKCALLDTLEGLLSSVDASVKAKLQVLINTLTAVIKAGKTDAEDVVLQCAYELSTILAEAKKNSAAAIKFAEIAAWGTINDLLNVAIALKAPKAPSVIVLVPGNNGSTCALLEALLNVSVHVEAENQFSFKAFISKINSCVFSKKSTTAILAEIANEFQLFVSANAWAKPVFSGCSIENFGPLSVFVDVCSQWRRLYLLPSLFQPGSLVGGLLADLNSALGFVGGILGDLLGLVNGLLGGITNIVNNVALGLLQKVDGVVVLLQRFIGGLTSVLAKFDFYAQPIGLSFHFGTVGDLLDCYSVMNIINPSFSPVC
ncbi:hypothetical protein L596_020690 [Steinernema carpocapsae]|uniref:Uncharacterized protein n=1 Tax=Steinernema carpocapsae TaxID=34508 RepID=A0A4U5MUA6_STECR|nr:hypothetical protein L596_020690 [Steinernema carpocapsae]